MDVTCIVGLEVAMYLNSCQLNRSYSSHYCQRSDMPMCTEELTTVYKYSYQYMKYKIFTFSHKLYLYHRKQLRR